MKSKSFELCKDFSEIQNKMYSFSKYYKPSSESNKSVEKTTTDGGSGESTVETKSHVSKRDRPKKKKKMNDDSMNISAINTGDNNSPHSSKQNEDVESPNTKMTSTPNVEVKKDVNKNVKSIMKNSSLMDNSLEISTVSMPKRKPKKRNKSGSFMLDNSEKVAIKRSKSDLSDSKITQNNKTNFISLKNKKPKKKSQDEKENKADMSYSKMVTDTSEKKPKLNENSLNQESENINETDEGNVKKIKKKKRHTKPTQLKTETEGEPAKKSLRKVMKPDVIAKDLENLSIGDNAHTLTNLLDEMSVVDKKKKKNKHKLKKNKQQNITPGSASDLNETKEVKEKVKWMKRKWNKDRKGGVSDDKLTTSIVIKNLPLKIMCNYKKLLTEHFTKFGMIKLVGIAEIYSIEHPEVFTTTINFDTEDAAIKALEEDNTLFEGNRIRVSRPLPPTQTTLVVKSYADLTEAALSSVFTSAGCIRNVQRLVKGRNSICTAFIKFDDPEAVERAIKMAEDVEICGKKIFAAKFDLRNKNKKMKTEKEPENDIDSDVSSD